MKTALVLRHLAFEDLGCLHPVLEQAGYAVQYVEMGVTSLALYPALAPDLVVVLGGPIAACDGAGYPWLAQEIAWLRTRLLVHEPTLGICLGAQLMAAALGAPVYPAAVKELGWGGVCRTRESDDVPGLAAYLDAVDAVLHWHGDTFDLPAGARRLAFTSACENQAFSWGNHGLGIQFHPEFDPVKLEQWLIGHALELAQARGITLERLRADTARYGPRAQAAARRFFAAWLDSLADKAGEAKIFSLRIMPQRCLRNF